MPLSPEAQLLYDDPLVQPLINASRNAAQKEYLSIKMSWGEQAYIRREGRYPLHADEGVFDTTLLRVLPPNTENPSFQGGEFRVLANQYERPAEIHRDSAHVGMTDNALIVVDTIPIFLKELSDRKAQDALAQARARVASYKGSAYLVQTRASDVHDGEYRTNKSGQLDLRQEIWFSKVLTVMHRFPGLSAFDAQKVLGGLGEKIMLTDTGLGVATVLTYFNKGAGPEGLETELIDGIDFLDLFPAEAPLQLTPEEIIQAHGEEVRELIQQTTSAEERVISLPDANYRMRTIARYPIVQDGTVFYAELVSAQKEDTEEFRTFRILSHGDSSDSYVRIDSICVNGVQAGDTHCDCRLQSEIEKARAHEGMSIKLINIRDDEGRGHGEGDKGGTLALQRLIRQLIGTQVGNGIAAQLYYYETGDPVDRRDYAPVQALLRYLNIDHIAHLVTNNTVKIAKVGEVCMIGEVVDAVVGHEVSEEARSTMHDKVNGRTGVAYDYTHDK